MRRVIALIGTGFVLLLPPAASAVTIVFACGQDVPSRDEGTLIADLNCGPSGLGVHLGSHTRLHLNGHTITGGAIGVMTHAGKTEIEGPGAIVGATQVGVFAPNNEGHHTAWIHGGVELSGHALAAIALGQANKVKLILEDVDIHDNPGSGIADCTGLKVKATDVSIVRSAAGICGDGIVLIRSEVEDNQGMGIFSWRAHVRLKDSTATGNDAAGNNWDVATRFKPQLGGTSSCGHSVVVPKFPDLPTPTSPSWGVCAND